MFKTAFYNLTYVYITPVSHCGRHEPPLNITLLILNKESLPINPYLTYVEDKLSKNCKQSSLKKYNSFKCSNVQTKAEIIVHRFNVCYKILP